MLTTTEKLKEYLGITTTSDDALLGHIIEYVSGFIESSCRRAFSLLSRVEYHNGAAVIHTKNYPIAAIASIKENTGSFSNPSWVIVDSDAYDVNKDTGMISFSSAPAVGVGNVEITYTAGFSEIPGDIGMVAIELSAKKYGQRKSQGIKSEGTSSFRIDWSTDLTEEQKLVIERNTKPLI